MSYATPYAHTLRRRMRVSGRSLHSGESTEVSLSPKKSRGIVFIVDGTEIAALPENFTPLPLSTCLRAKNKSVGMVEHFMAALAFLHVDRLYVKLKGDSLPVLDGACQKWLNLLTENLQCLDEHVKTLKPLRPVRVERGDSWIQVEPAEKTILDVHVTYGQHEERMSFVLHEDNPKSISRAKTFGYLHQVEELRAKNLARGATLANTLALRPDGSLVQEQQKDYENKNLVRHKILDLLGDLYLWQGVILARITCYKSGHILNNMALRAIVEV